MFSIIICTHNPNPDNFQRVIAAINRQSLPKSEWEWIIVDNASKETVNQLIPESLKTMIAVINEPTPGLTPARLAGIRNAKNDWLVLVDDDNILHPDFLLQAKSLILSNKNLGALGGKLLPEFEQEPAPEIVPHLLMLAIRNPQTDYVGRSYDWDNTPFGAGMVVRRHVALHYMELVEKDPLRKNLDRKGNSLMSSGDVDLAHCALDLGYETGVFTSLSLTHIIPAFRVSKAYILNMMRYNMLSNHLLFYIRFKRIPRKPNNWKMLKKYLSLIKHGQWFEWGILRARNQATREAIAQIEKLEFKQTA